jgi:hypothetical protein
MHAFHESLQAWNNVRKLVTELTNDIPVSEQPKDEPWPDVLARMQVDGRIAEISEEVWFYFLEVLPPKLIYDNWFCFAEGHEPLKLFWRRLDRFYVRQLTWGGDTPPLRCVGTSEGLRFPLNHGAVQSVSGR